MRVLLDTCVWGGAQDVLREKGHEVEWVGDWEQDPGDKEILSHAFANGFVLVTLDKDFGELAIAQGQPHHGLIRLVNLRARQQGAVCARVLLNHERDLVAERSSPLRQTGFVYADRSGRLRDCANKPNKWSANGKPYPAQC